MYGTAKRVLAVSAPLLGAVAFAVWNRRNRSRTGPQLARSRHVSATWVDL